MNLSIEYVTVYCGPPDTGGCNLQFAMTRNFYDYTKRTGEGWWCPAGHERVWADDTVEEQLQRAEARNQHLEDQLRASVQEAENTRIALLRDRQRFANGVCPCCQRSFDNVRRHMQAKHPDYDITRVKELPRLFSCSCGSRFETLRGLRIHQGHMRREGWDAPKASKWRAHLTRI